MRVIHGVNTLRNATGPGRLANATVILSKKEWLPKYLALALQKLT